MIKVELPFLTKMFNIYKGVHWGVADTERKRVMEHMMHQLTPLRRLKTPIDIVVTRCSSVRPDFDNMVSGGKYIIDALVKLEMIPDDAPDFVRAMYHWAKAPPREGKMLIEILEAGEQYNAEEEKTGGSGP